MLSQAMQNFTHNALQRMHVKFLKEVFFLFQNNQLFSDYCHGSLVQCMSDKIGI